jgi:sporulation protein YlmC with PRC-barrel domain
MKHKDRYTALIAAALVAHSGAALAQNPQRENTGNEYSRSLSYDDYLEGADLRASRLVGKTVRNAEGENLGEIDELLITTDDEDDMQLILSVGGFLGIGDKLVAVPYDELRVAPSGDQLFIDRTRAQLEAAPAFGYERALHDA